MSHEATQEVLDRVRRIETRVTKLGDHFGIELGGSRPSWSDGSIYLPTPNCSIGSIVNLIPQGWPRQDGIDVFVGRDYLMTLYVDP
jgi:hypothetical protein